MPVLYNNVSIDLSYLRTRLDTAERCGDAEGAVEVQSRQNHALTLDAHHLARCKVGDEEHVLALEVLGFVELGDTRENCAVGAAAVVDGELKELVRLLNASDRP